MSMDQSKPSINPDSEYRGAMAALPPSWRAYAGLARFDRPIGWWLLYWPCFWGLALGGGLTSHWPLAIWMVIGAIAMRGAGCVYNDIVDRDLDAKVARTANRPVASGAVSLKSAWIWLISLCLIGLVVLLQLPLRAQVMALASLILVAAYPFMKRITWWPQAWLGMVFSWGALVGWLSVRSDGFGTLALLYAGSIAWVIGYDTIYAVQDKEDDAIIGIKSSALRLGSQVKAGVGAFYLVAILCWSAAIWSLRPQVLALIALLPAALHLGWQVLRLDPGNGDMALTLFRSNRFAGFLVAMAMLVVGSTA
jgi:4-hydroxybenzoate polyprenyltransferase